MELPRWVRGRETREWAILVVTIAAILGLIASFSIRKGDLAQNYLVGVVLTIGISAIFALGLSIQMGHAGLLNFGHVAFMGIGGYTVAIWSLRMQPSLAPQLEGEGFGGAAMTALVALLAGAIVYAVLAVLVQRVPLSARARLLLALVPALLVAAVIAYNTYPMGPRSARSAVVLLGILLAVALAALAGLLMGLAALRLREDYLAIVTLGLSQILLLFALNEEWLTNGSQGIVGLHRPLVAWANDNDGWKELARSWEVLPVDLMNTMVTLIVLVVAFILLEALARSPWGRVLRAIREDEEVASALGKNVLLYRLQALMIGAALAAMAGILLIWRTASVLPEHFVALITFQAFAMLVLGGIGNHKGAILGAFIIWGIIELAGQLNVQFQQEQGTGIFADLVKDFAGPKQQILIGVILMLVVLFRPQGAVGNKEELALGK